MNRGTVWFVFANGDSGRVPLVTHVEIVKKNGADLLCLWDNSGFESLYPVDRGTYVLANIRSWKKEDR